jgi:uncharacterized protein YbjT (DUF2867 family)
MHGEAELRLEQSGMAFTHLRAGEFMPAYFRQAPSIAATSSFMLPMEDARIASIDVGDLADVAALALTMSEVAEKLSSAIGRPVRYVNVRPEEHRAANLSRGMPPYLADGLVELYAERRNGKEGTVFPDTETLLGRRPVSFGEFAQRNAAAFRGEQPAAKV